MMFVTTFARFVIISSLPIFVLTSQTFSLKESFLPHRDWVAVKHAPATNTIVLKLIFSLPQFSTIENHLYAVSDPESPRYGQHLSLHDVRGFLKPQDDNIKSVDKWLEQHGFDATSLKRSPSFDWIEIETTVGTAEEMLNTKYHVWKNLKTNATLIRTTQWSLPSSVHEHIDLIHPTTMFGGKSAMKSLVLTELNTVGHEESTTSSNIDPSCNNTITPTCLLELYNAAQYKPQAADKGNKIAISSYLNEFANLKDLQRFYETFVPAAEGSAFNVVHINGGINNQTLSVAGPEADLDVQYAFGLTFPLPATVFTTGGSPPFIPDLDEPTNTNEPYLDWLDFVLALPDNKLPQTISTSYADEEQTVPFTFAKAVCERFAVLGLRGVSLLFGSGDNGVGDGDPDPKTTTCLSNDGLNRTQFLPSFPASCPFVTTVGGTVNVPEVAVTRFGSGGGFSNYFPRPAYQSRSVEVYLRALGNDNAGLFNPLGRAFPDVAAQADNYQIILRNRTVSIGGTSAATPTFAAIVALLNDARITNGKSALGFLNPLLYSKRVRMAKTAFNDITMGNNPGCGTQGFECRIGWDPVTGLGTPNFEVLKSLLDAAHGEYK